jgi:hypothetical protein
LLAGAVGDPTVAAKLKSVSLQAGGGLKLTANAGYHIDTIDVGNNNAELVLGDAAGGAVTAKIINFKSTNNNGKLIIAHGATLKAGTVISTKDNKLDGVLFSDNKTLTLENAVDLYTVNGIKKYWC